MYKEGFETLEKAFKDNNMEDMKRSVGWLAKLITITLMNEDYDDLKDICKYSTLSKSEVEFIKPTELTEDYLKGYWYAYENIARRFIDEHNLQENYDVSIKENNQLENIINYLYCVDGCSSEQLSEHLQIKKENLERFINDKKDLQIFSITEFPKHTLYKLNKRGREQFEKCLR